MGYVDESAISCGVVELHDLSKRPRDNCADVLQWWESEWYDQFAYVIFSDVVKSSFGDLTNNGTKLANYIKKHGLGTLTSPRRKKNPNSGNIIKVWIWSPNITALRKVV